MPITFHPHPGQMLLCDFSDFKEPEIVKRNRPVIVLSSALKGRDKLLTIVPLSTVKPNPIQPYHYLLPKKSMPMISNFQERESWVKGDMLYTVSFHRLNLIKLITRNLEGKRDYFKTRLGRDQMREIYKCVLHGLNLSKLTKHL
jgi:mRNA interferase MazF